MVEGFRFHCRESLLRSRSHLSLVSKARLTGQESGQIVSLFCMQDKNHLRSSITLSLNTNSAHNGSVRNPVAFTSPAFPKTHAS